MTREQLERLKIYPSREPGMRAWMVFGAPEAPHAFVQRLLLRAPELLVLLLRAMHEDEDGTAWVTDAAKLMAELDLAGEL